MRLESKVAAITGAGRGIGRAVAEMFAKEGARVAILEANPETGADAEKKIKEAGGIAEFIQTDISKADSVKNAFLKIERFFGGLHVLYNNASVYWREKDDVINEISLEAWHEIISINLNGLFYCCKYAIPVIMKGGGGSVINTASSAGLIGVPKCDAYTATKGAVISLTRSMAVEYGPKNIRVNCIAPAAVYTPMVRESDFKNPDFDEEIFLTKGTPLRRWGTPEEIARIALFLASGESSYVNGAIIVADGGITIS
jgi:NAD(P)-dependent dehydrogenase (short-subunit alcohol dehydrogenase family)